MAPPVAAATGEELLPQYPQQMNMDMVQTSHVTAVMERGECGGYVDASIKYIIDGWVCGW